MPIIRGHNVLTREKARVCKRTFDALVWIEELSRHDFVYLDLLEQLRIYLDREHNGTCQIRLLVPSSFARTQEALKKIRIPFMEVATINADEPFLKSHVRLTDPIISTAAATAKCHNADCIILPKGSTVFPYIQDVIEEIHCLITDAEFLLRLSELYVRGFEIPWTFRLLMWDATWTTFYLHAEPETAQPLLSLFSTIQTSGCPPDAQEATRSLVFNRIPQLLYTRDRILWFEIQREATKREGLTNQDYAFEISYYLNFYYLLLSATFDHLALIVNGVCNLGLKDKQVGATYKPFLDELIKQSPQIHALFVSKEILDLIAQFAALRNLAAHRGAITPRKIVAKPDREPTVEEIDEHMRKTGNGWILEEPFSSMSPGLVRMARQNAWAELIEKEAVADDVEYIEIAGKAYFMSPLLNTSWNLKRTLAFCRNIIDECSNFLRTKATASAPK
jgi:hypothetical protein